MAQWKRSGWSISDPHLKQKLYSSWGGISIISIFPSKQCVQTCASQLLDIDKIITFGLCVFIFVFPHPTDTPTLVYPNMGYPRIFTIFMTIPSKKPTPSTRAWPFFGSPASQPGSAKEPIEVPHCEQSEYEGPFGDLAVSVGMVRVCHSS